MQHDGAKPRDSASASVDRAAGLLEALCPRGYYKVQCIGPNGQVKWEDEIHNLITTAGKNHWIDVLTLSAGFTSTFRMGLKGAGSAVAGDTQASHAGWSEVGLANAPTYTGNRKTVTMGGAAAASAVSPTQAFAILTGGTVAGCFINSGGSATKDDTTGTLFSAGAFTGGSKTVDTGDTVNVTYTLSLT